MKNLKIFDQSTKALKWCTWVNLGMLTFSLIGMLVDNRQLLGENVWLKPAKFAVSIPIYCITIALLLSIYPYTFKIKKRISRLIGWVLILEVPLIMIQAYRGVRSHFNTTTALDGIIFGSMGLLILINTIVLFYMMWTAFTKDFNASKLMQRAVQFGWIGMIVSIVAGQQMLAARGHSVGIPDGGAGIPITHWSTEGGDWRAVHFLGMHGMQILPLMAYFLERQNWKNSWLMIWGIGIFYLTFIGYIYTKTQAGMPFITV
ncbi:MAG: hypothetical protein AAGJ18_11880 [Bacteroidota bacterium]